MIYLAGNSITWLYAGAENVSNNINRLTVLIKPVNGEIRYHIGLPLKTQLNVSTKLSIDIIGSERIYYQFTSSLFLYNNTNGIGRVDESVEGNINIDSKDIVVQWHKQEVRIPIRVWGNSTSTVLPLKREMLDRVVSEMNYTYIKRLNGFYVVERLRNLYRESFYFYDIYVDRSGYFNTLFSEDAQLCKVIDRLPMKASIDLNASTSLQEYVVKLDIQGANADDPVRAYQAYLCILPLLLSIQDISKNVDVENRFSTEFIGMTVNLFIKINWDFIVNALKIYTNVTSTIARNYPDLVDSLIVFDYVGGNQKQLLLRISDSVHQNNATQVRVLVKEIASSLLESAGIAWYVSAIDQSSIVFQSDYTTPTVASSEEIGVWNLLVLVTIAVGIQTGVLVYAMTKILRSKQHN